MRGLIFLNIIRKNKQVAQLKDMGAEYILNSSGEEFLDNLKKMPVDLNAKIAYDMIGAEITGMLVNYMCENSVVYMKL
ncbi:hypothetical protein SteCoe_35272 [Stentor coeruleus]|uniref:Alcohol dehydrogenase-like C-terminal domain-containing protein n=1 Tax=Stentor coeruleus TaxID=5963 RepID=A0A1R2AT10_9CILI|nr:hypothetical protein SteCoe_35272 [Stentor coeruleus]